MCVNPTSPTTSPTVPFPPHNPPSHPPPPGCAHRGPPRSVRSLATGARPPPRQRGPVGPPPTHRPGLLRHLCSRGPPQGVWGRLGCTTRGGAPSKGPGGPSRGRVGCGGFMADAVFAGVGVGVGSYAYMWNGEEQVGARLCCRYLYICVQICMHTCISICTDTQICMIHVYTCTSHLHIYSNHTHTQPHAPQAMQFEIDIGNTEYAIACIQTILEFNIMAPPSLPPLAGFGGPTTKVCDAACITHTYITFHIPITLHIIHPTRTTHPTNTTQVTHTTHPTNSMQVQLRRQDTNVGCLRCFGNQGCRWWGMWVHRGGHRLS